MKAKDYRMSIRCYFSGDGNYTQHYPVMPLQDIAKWIEAYRFTHTAVQAITVKVWLNDRERGETECE